MTKDNEPLCPIVFYKHWDKIISVGYYISSTTLHTRIVFALNY